VLLAAKKASSAPSPPAARCRGSRPSPTPWSGAAT